MAFPRTSDSSTHPSAEEAQQIIGNEIRGTILVVDDNVLDFTILQHALTRAGFRVEGAECGKEALARVAANRPDLVLLDVVMPDMDGVEVLRHIREESSRVEVPVIMVTYRDDSGDVVTALRDGANDYVTKPVDIDVLLARVDTQIELRRLSRLKEEFIGMASHDLKNPLTSIILSTTLLSVALKKANAFSERVTESMDILTRSTRSMKRIVEDFLDIQALDDRRVSLDTAACDLASLLKDAVANLSGYAASKEIALRCDGTAGPRPITADGSRIRQVLDNLIGNAIKFSPPGTCVRTRLMEDAGDCVRCEVQDQGPGLPPSEMSRLFTKYGRLGTLPTGGEKSSGIGLYICHRLISLHGGEIGARNCPEGGATFWFCVPRAPAAA